jgi:hypothetical protein
MTLASVGVLCAALLVGGNTVTNSELGFQFEMPDGYSRVELPQDDVLHAYSKGNDEGIPTLLVVGRMHGTLDRTPLPSDLKMPDGTPVEVYEERWREFTLHVVRVARQTDGEPYLMLNVEVPLRPEAIHIRVEGTASREEEMRQLLHGVLASLQGETNWLSTRERLVRAGEFGAVLLLAIVAGVAVFVVWRKQRRSRSSPQNSAGQSPPTT